MHGYFDARGLKGLPDARRMFVEITDFEDLNMKDGTAFLTQVLNIQTNFDLADSGKSRAGNRGFT